MCTIDFKIVTKNGLNLELGYPTFQLFVRTIDRTHLGLFSV